MLRAESDVETVEEAAVLECESWLSPRQSILHSIQQFKGTTPGTVFPARWGNRNAVLDPTHPALRTPHSQMTVTFSALTLRIVPKGLLYHPSIPVGPAPYNPKQDPGQVDVSVRVVMGANKFPSAVMRAKVASKIKNAMSLVVTRGAYVEENAEGKPKIEFREKDASRDWIRNGYTYVFHPPPELYRMPYQTLIPIVRKLLGTARYRGQKLEDLWAGRGAPRSRSTPANHQSRNRPSQV
ncbi:uncharacterized protein C8Q71DRAFT_863166 [Rhodofomes roseus]|uniref:Uncharacterized protein n=1 Tax=Rhodofomes roseus TaxID=34475 RepID=A0ABQ8K0I8_9APHY|nr:uncharacterized protein C8Q71DRAFT_863166 [Rhodofomes roseus]KAH9829591.1 hypothetical protein C8Q71DRAFT_863166 [Rhodofomes roseus]